MAHSGTITDTNQLTDTTSTMILEILGYKMPEIPQTAETNRGESEGQAGTIMEKGAQNVPPAENRYHWLDEAGLKESSEAVIMAAKK